MLSEACAEAQWVKADIELVDRHLPRGVELLEPPDTNLHNDVILILKFFF